MPWGRGEPVLHGRGGAMLSIRCARTRAAGPRLRQRSMPRRRPPRRRRHRCTPRSFPLFAQRMITNGCRATSAAETLSRYASASAISIRGRIATLAIGTVTSLTTAATITAVSGSRNPTKTDGRVAPCGSKRENGRAARERSPTLLRDRLQARVAGRRGGPQGMLLGPPLTTPHVSRLGSGQQHQNRDMLVGDRAHAQCTARVG
jgi:hypothetical protein